MADKAIGDLTPATAVGVTDLFVLEQNSVAKSLTGNTLKNWLLELAEGHGGIASIAYTAPVYPSLVGTMTITYADDTTATLNINNGRGISSISSPTTIGLVKTYTINYNDGTTSTFAVTDGETGAAGANAYVHIKYSSVQPTQDGDMHDTADKWMGIYSGNSSTAPTHYTQYVWYEIKGTTGTAASVALGSVSTTQLPAGSQCTCDITATGVGTAQTTLNFAFGLAKGQDGTGAGTVTSVAVAQDTGDDTITLTGDTTITSSGTVKLGHKDYLTDSVTTQAAYPFTVNKKGHITGVGAALTPAALGAISDPASKSNGQVLTYNGSSWVAQNPSGAVTSVNNMTGAVTLNYSHVGAIANPSLKSANQYLKYNGSNWVASTLPQVSLVKIWENASETSEFAGQRITVDSSAYDCVFIEIKRTTDQAAYLSFPVLSKSIAYNLNIMNANAKTYWNRSATVDDSGVSFTNCYKCVGTTNSQDNSGAIPVAVYGLANISVN